MADTAEPEPYTAPAPQPYGQARSELACGDHTLAAGTYTIKSPNHPSNYGNNFDCSYNLALGSGVTSLSLSCSAFNIESHSSCAWDWLQVDSTKYCGTTAPSVNSNGAMAISFHSDYSVVRAGYLCTITATGSGGSGSELACGEYTLAEGTYTIKSPNHPSNYGNNFDCAYNLTPGSGVGTLDLSCSAFNIESHSSCRWDWLRVDGTKFCGTAGPTVSSNSVMNVDFHADGSVVRTGYLCTIEARAGTSPPCTDCCGQVNRATRVVGGVETEVNEYPWQAGLVTSGGTRTWCGGSLINDRYVVTAAHCTAGNTASRIEVLLGDHRISVADGETRHTVAEIKDHPSYTSYQNGFDISLLRLATPVTYNTKIAPACLPTAGENYAGAQAIATGFGRVGAGLPQATELQEVQLEVRTQTYCGTQWSFLKASMICAGGTSSGGTSVCNGDSGGPLVTLENNRYALIGVVSFGRPCAFPNTPDVYCRVTEALAWIQSSTADATYCPA